MAEPVFIAGTGAYLPGDPIPFERIDALLGPLEGAPPKIQKWMAKTREVMRELLDIRFLHYAIDPVTREFTDDNVTMATKAARQAMAAAGIGPEAIDLLCYGSAHQDQMPTASVLIQEALGIGRCAEFSIHANCTSAYKALYLARELLAAGRYRNALVVSSGISSSELRAEYYNQELVDKESLFLRWFLCDGAGAVLLSTDPSRSRGFELEHAYVESVGGGRRPHMFNRRPALWLSPKEEWEKGLHHLRQRFANSLSTEVFQEPGGSIFFCGFFRMLEQCGVPLDSIRLFQVNLPAKHIAESVMDEFEKKGFDRSRFYTKLGELGYSGPPMAFICLDRIVREERLRKGERIASFVTEVSKFMQAGYIARSTGDDGR